MPTQIGAEGIRFDFNFGVRVLFPEGGTEPYTLRLYDLDSGMPLEQFLCKPGDFFVGERKYYVRYRLEVLREDRLILQHDYDCCGKRVHVVLPDGGLGDNLAWLPYAELFQKLRGANVACVLGEWMIKLVGDLYPGLDLVANRQNAMLNDSYANYFVGIFPKDRKSWRPVDHQFLGMQASVASILGLPQEPLKCRLHLGSKRPFPEPYVCISSLGTNPAKDWNYPGGWDEIIRRLRTVGYRVLDIDRDRKLTSAGKDYSIPSEAEDFTGFFPLQERIELLEHADFFIGLPSGLSWLAWNTNIPVVMLVGFTMPNCEFPTPYRVTNHLFCHGCWNDTGCFFDQMAPVWCPRHAGTPREIECTRAITPKMVWDAIRRVPAFQRQAAKIRGE